MIHKFSKDKTRLETTLGNAMTSEPAFRHNKHGEPFLVLNAPDGGEFYIQHGRVRAFLTWLDSDSSRTKLESFLATPKAHNVLWEKFSLLHHSS